jgi:hypothetical protein
VIHHDKVLRPSNCDFGRQSFSFDFQKCDRHSSTIGNEIWLWLTGRIGETNYGGIGSLLAEYALGQFRWQIRQYSEFASGTAVALDVHIAPPVTLEQSN